MPAYNNRLYWLFIFTRYLLSVYTNADAVNKNQYPHLHMQIMGLGNVDAVNNRICIPFIYIYIGKCNTFRLGVFHYHLKVIPHCIYLFFFFFW